MITFGPLDEDEDWEPVVCGPYERAHALSLAETVVADEELMAVVEPVLPHTTVDQIQAEIASAQLLAQEAEDEAVEDDEIEAFLDDHDHDHDEYDEGEEVEPSTPPSPEEIRAGFARIAAKLTSA
ncbi:hypothetical protein ACFQX7_16485 [Luedemannella flava]